MTVHRATSGAGYCMALSKFWSSFKGETPVSAILTDYRQADDSLGRFYIDIVHDTVTGGFIIKPDGELVGVFSALHGRGDDLVSAALNAGATHLDCFDGYLTEFYRRHGFVEYFREPNWTPGGPAVVYMGLPSWIEKRAEELRTAATQAEAIAKCTGSVGATVINDRVTYGPNCERVIHRESVETHLTDPTLGYDETTDEWFRRTMTPEQEATFREAALNSLAPISEPTDPV